jgi:lipoprotein-releasing system ATP-binding protein
MNNLIEARGILKVFRPDGGRVEALRDIDLGIKSDETLGVVGVSGSGKSTLLHILGTLERPTEGEVYYRGSSFIRDGDDPQPDSGETNIFKLGDTELASFRNQEIGFVFQFHYLLREFSALENVMMPALIQGIDKNQAELMATDVLEKVGLVERLAHRPGELSGGEQQRVAIARAIVLKPKVIFADEPTGNLDLETGLSILDLFLKLNGDYGIVLVLVTHNPELAMRLSRRIRLSDGKIVDDD